MNRRQSHRPQLVRRQRRCTGNFCALTSCIFDRLRTINTDLCQALCKSRCMKPPKIVRLYYAKLKLFLSRPWVSYSYYFAFMAAIMLLAFEKIAENVTITLCALCLIESAVKLTLIEGPKAYIRKVANLPDIILNIFSLLYFCKV